MTSPYEPPRANRKYSQSLEFALHRLESGIHRWVPDFLKPGETMAVIPLTAAALSVIPGLGAFYLTQKFRGPLLQFGVWALLFFAYLFSFGSSWGFFIAMAMFSYHQYLMYSAYLKGLVLNQIPPPSFWGGLRLSLLMAAPLALFYLLLTRPLANHLYYAQMDLQDTVAQGDRFFIVSEDPYLPGQIVVFNRSFLNRDTRLSASLLERILAKEGDQVEVTNGKLLVNGQALPQGAGPLEEISLSLGAFTIPPNSYFVLYPIRTNQTLDPHWFIIQKESIQGKLALRYFPSLEALP